jgi:cytochrome c oxidase assembly protein subunit 15
MQQKSNKAVGYWLLLGAFLVLAMVVIGGITRLTHSGLSMVDWKPISGTLPPLNQEEWITEFEHYKTSPEFQEINTHFELEDFKEIFFWEYFHRLIGRVIGLVFIFPFLYFLWKKQIQGRGLMRNLVIIFFLGGFQGFLGWYMVKSGLVKDPAVSHYRLAMHLSNAFLLVAYILWTSLKVFYPNWEAHKTSLRKGYFTLLFILTVQIIYGAFVAGLKAGLIFPTYPKMGGSWVPQNIATAFENEGFVSLIGNPVSVQFIHRWLAVLVVSVVAFIYFKGKKLKLNSFQKNANNGVLIMVLLQFLLGVLTLINMVPVSLGVLHQLGAAILLCIVIIGIYFNSFTKEPVLA